MKVFLISYFTCFIYSNLVFSQQPTLNRPLNTFDGLGPGKSIWPNRCLNQNYLNHPLKLKPADQNPDTFNNKGYSFEELDPSCMPSIVFTWADDYILKSLILKNYGDPKSVWEKPIKRVRTGLAVNSLFTSFSPVSTYPYGDNVIRIKFRKGIKYWFNFSPADTMLACNSFSEDMKKNGVFVRTIDWEGGTGVEYNLCSFGPVESWSYNQKETYDEIVKDYLMFKKTKNKNGLILYSHYKNRGPDIFDINKIDGYFFTEKSLEKKLKTLLGKILKKGSGKIYYNPSSKHHSNHFLNPKPIYWNKLNP